MSFVNKFKQANSSNSDLPTGVKLENTSFGQVSEPYTGPKFRPPQPSSHQKGKPRGGWDDEEEDQPTLAGLNNNKPTFTLGHGNTGNTATVPKPSLLISTSNKATGETIQPSQQQESYQKFAVVPIDENFEQAHEYELKVINELIQPGGARLRQPDSILREFSKAAETLQAEVIGSILLDSLSSQGIWISKARAIFAIEALVKNNVKYYSYFKHNIRKLRRNEFEDEGINASQLIKFLDDLIDHLEDPEKGFSTPIQEIPVPTSLTEPNSSASPDEIQVKTYAQSAVIITQPGLTSQLVSESAENVSATDSPNSSQATPASSGSFLSKFKKNAAAKAQANAEQNKMENIMNSLAGLDFNADNQEKPQEEQAEQPKAPNFDDVYNLYLSSNNHQHPHHMQYQNMHNPNMHNAHIYNGGAHPNAGVQYQYNPQAQYYAQQQYQAQLARQKQQAQYYQAQGMYNAGYGMNTAPVVSDEEYFKKKVQDENEKRFDNLKFGF